MLEVEYILIVFGVILVSMTLHEAMHAFVGYFLGDDTAKAQGRLTLNPLKHIDPFMTIILPLLLAIFRMPVFGGAKPVPFNPSRVRYGEYGVALIALSGPLTNLLIAFFTFGIGVISGLISSSGIATDSWVGVVVQTTILVNLGFFVFNMIPIPPLDGSRVLYAIAPDFVRKGMNIIESSFGPAIIFVTIILFSSVIGNIMTTCINAILGAFMAIFHV